MARDSLLKVVQDILSDMDSDEVNSIGDTAEAQQVATVAQQVFDEIAEEHEIEQMNTLFQLQALADPNKPTHFNIPENVHTIEWVKYDIRQALADKYEFSFIGYLEPIDFMDVLDKRDSNASNIQEVVDSSGIKMLIRNDIAPTCYTSIDSEQIILDAFDSTVDTTLQSSKTQCYGVAQPHLTIDDNTIVDLPEHLYALFRSAVRARCFDQYKDGTPVSIERAARRQRVRAQRQKSKLRINREHDRRPDYGRHTR